MRETFNTLSTKLETMRHMEWKNIWINKPKTWCLCYRVADYPVEDVSPALHGDALEHSEHGKQKIVEVGDAIVGTLPALPANSTIEQAMTSMS